MNKRLLIGLLITSFFALIAAFGPMLAPYSPEHQLEMHYDAVEGLIAPPAEPGADYWFGTDKYGYDILTKLLYGARYTIAASIAVALLRVLIAGGAGMYAGYYIQSPRLTSLLSGLNGIPIFILVYFMMYGITINSSLSTVKLTAVLVAVMTVLGLPSVFSVVVEKTREVKKRQYVLASSAIGASDSRIIFRHIFPQLKESYLILFVNEIIVVLAIFGQLGIFNLFVGGTFFNPQGEPPTYFSITNEWAGLIGSSRFNLQVYEWVLMFPLAAYVLLIIGFYLISKGLEAIYKDKYSKVPHI